MNQMVILLTLSLILDVKWERDRAKIVHTLPCLQLCALSLAVRKNRGES